MTVLAELGDFQIIPQRAPRRRQAVRNREEVLTAVSTAQVIKLLESSNTEQLGHICLRAEFSTTAKPSCLLSAPGSSTQWSPIGVELSLLTPQT